ncbi:hypothetical protein KGF56_002476 [Candida oxycetoniae]|uniref:Uncharacterized protein n=1 Tax=Candida oxycetoniae TaxID=497107 RepID=A0AAI9WXY1_9ASCO|nr:uncharacterized protein KGF56_002476 [Candida oxycetoniae]KAI3404708.2 hypothetical protein KGF56_002476 [Candida oxycetoniae]
MTVTLDSPPRSKVFEKQLDEHLLIKLRYLTAAGSSSSNIGGSGSNSSRSTTTSTTQTCELTFQNTSENEIVINPERPTSESTSWFPSIFKTTDSSESSKMLNKNNDKTVELFLGYVQIFGYVVLNYKFNLDTSTLEMNRHHQWWNNAHYLDQYAHKDDKGTEEKDDEWKIETTPFILQHIDQKIKVGGKLAGVTDLAMDLPDNATTNNASLLFDLIGNFNTHSSSKDALPLNEFVDSIVPIYATPQSLIFTNVALAKGSSRTFRFQIPINDRLPPSYNTRSTGIACDQGWTSIRFSLVVSLHQDSLTTRPKTIYFPLQIRLPKHPSSKFLQKIIFGDRIGLDKDWTISDATKSVAAEEVRSKNSAKKDFLLDLSSLIDSDLYNMPKVSTSERRRSSTNNLHTEAHGDYITQLPSHLKTSYFLKVNNKDLCKISISKPYYNIGDDVHFSIDMDLKGANKIIGVNGYLETCEVYHTPAKEIKNVYKATGNVKLNLLASAMSNISSSCIVNDYLNIPKFLSPQFQSTAFMDLKYFLTFQFNFANFSLLNKENPDLGKAFAPGKILRGEMVGSTYTFRVPFVAQSQYISPASDPLSLDVTPRDLTDLYQIQERDLASFVGGLLSEINVTSIVDSINFDEIAGWVNGLLTENDNVKYLDYILDFLGSTNLVPAAISFIVSNNATRSIAYDVVIELLGISSQFDLTPVFVALKNSGLAYTLIADLIENPNTLPFVINVLKDTLSGSSIGEILGGSGGSGSVSAAAVASQITFATSNVVGNSAGSGSASSLYFGDAPGSVNTNDINTASIAQLISEAAQQTEGGATTTIGATKTESVPAALSNAAASFITSAAAALSTGEVTSYDFATLTGPAFQSLPPSQFGEGPTTIDYSALGQLTAVIGGSGSQKRDAVYKVLEEINKRQEEKTAQDEVETSLMIKRDDEVETALMKMKRDNIEDLLTTIFSSIVRSNLLNDTIQYLVTDEKFEGSVVYLLQGIFQNIGSTLSGVLSTDWSKIVPLVKQLLNSGLLTDIITRAFNDEDLKNALYRDIQSLFKRDLIARDQVVSAFTLNVVTTTTASNYNVNSTSASSVVNATVSTIDAVNAGSPASLNFVPIVLGAIGFSALVL